MAGRMMVIRDTRELVRVPPVQALRNTSEFGPNESVWVDDGNDKGYPRSVRFGDLIPLEDVL